MISESNISLIITPCRALQATAHDLERQRAADSLKKGLEHRPEREELVESMIYDLIEEIGVLG